MQSHSAAVIETFVRLNEKNLLYRAKDLVNWSPALRSTISEIEVEDFVVNGKTRLQLPGYDTKITVGQLIRLAYPIRDSSKYKNKHQIKIMNYTYYVYKEIKIINVFFFNFNFLIDF